MSAPLIRSHDAAVCLRSWNLKSSIFRLRHTRTNVTLTCSGVTLLKILSVTLTSEVGCINESTPLAESPRVWKLSARVPKVQINVAAEGGRQVNVA